MSAASSKPIGRFLRAVRMRIWLQRAGDLGLRAAWLAAGIAVAGGAFHLMVRAHTAAPALAVAGLGAAAVLLHGRIWRRTSVAEAARRADLWFDGAALLTSAQDQLQLPAPQRAGAADFVLARAEETARVWHPRLRTERPLEGWRAFCGPLAVLLVGLFPYALPGAADPLQPTSADRGPALAARSELVEVAPESPDQLASIPWSGAQGELESEAALPSQAGRLVTSSPPDGLEFRREEPGPRPPEPADPAVGPASGTAPGASQPGENLLSPGPGIDSFSIVEIPRLPGTEGTGPPGRQIETAGGPDGAGPAGVPELSGRGVAARAELSPTLRAYVARYLRSIEESE